MKLRGRGVQPGVGLWFNEHGVATALASLLAGSLLACVPTFTHQEVAASLKKATSEQVGCPQSKVLVTCPGNDCTRVMGYWRADACGQTYSCRASRYRTNCEQIERSSRAATTTTLGPRGQHAVVVRKVDKFTGRVTYSLDPDFKEARERPVLTAYTSAPPGERPAAVLLAFLQISKGWQYLECHHVYFLIDGKRARPKTVHNGKGLGGATVLERVKMELGLAALETIAGSSSAEFRLCNYEARVSSVEKQKLREFLALLPPKTATAPASAPTSRPASDSAP